MKAHSSKDFLIRIKKWVISENAMIGASRKELPLLTSVAANRNTTGRPAANQGKLTRKFQTRFKQGAIRVE
jgi:hypothetical protein